MRAAVAGTMMTAVSRALRNAPGATAPTADDRSRRRRASSLGLAALLVLVAAVVGLHVRDYPTFSPIDELHHADYMIKAAHGQLLRRGDVMSDETRREGACREVDAPNQPPADCQDQSWLAGREFNTEEIQPPAYYFVTGLTARALRPLLGTSSLVTAGRVVGILWLGAAVVALWAALGLLDVPIWPRLAAGALLVTTPVVLHASATITDDASALVAGAGVLVAVLAWERRRVPAFVVPLAAFVAVSFRLTNFSGAGVVVIYLALRAWRPATQDEAPVHRSPRSLLTMAGAVVAAVVVSGVAWVGLNSAVARVGPLANPNTSNQQTCCLPLEAVLGQVGATVTPAHDPYLVPFLQNNKVRTLVSLTDWLLLGSAVGVAAFSGRGSPGEGLAAGTLVCALATGPLLTVTNYLFQGAFYGIPPRYGLSLMPGFAVAVALTLDKGWVRVCVTGLAAASVLTTLFLEIR